MPFYSRSKVGTRPRCRALVTRAVSPLYALSILFLAMACTVAPARANTEAKWRLAATASGRDLHAMAYDSLRGRMVLFGGWSGEWQGWRRSFSADTWAWDGTSWTLLSQTGPIGRGGAAMAYDSKRDRIVLFGGNDSYGGQLADTWEWDGSRWTQAAATGPIPRAHGAMAYDSVRGRTILFGGFHASGRSGVLRLADTWEWDGEQWREVEATGPAGRSGGQMAFDSRRGKMVLFGGLNTGEAGRWLGDTWEYDGYQWRQVSSTGPARRGGHAMAYDSRRGRVVLFGGFGDADQSLDGLWEWDGSQWRKTEAAGPSERGNHAMAYDSRRDRLVLMGGLSGGSYLGDTWEYGPPESPQPLGVAPPTFTLSDAIAALRWAAGIAPLPSASQGTYNVTDSGPSAGRVDIADALLILRTVTRRGPDAPGSRSGE